MKRGTQEILGGDEVTALARSYSSWPARKEDASAGDQPRGGGKCRSQGLHLG